MCPPDRTAVENWPPKPVLPARNHHPLDGLPNAGAPHYWRKIAFVASAGPLPALILRHASGTRLNNSSMTWWETLSEVELGSHPLALRERAGTGERFWRLVVTGGN